MLINSSTTHSSEESILKNLGLCSLMSLIVHQIRTLMLQQAVSFSFDGLSYLAVLNDSTNSAGTLIAQGNLVKLPNLQRTLANPSSAYIRYFQLDFDSPNIYISLYIILTNINKNQPHNNNHFLFIVIFRMLISLRKRQSIDSNSQATIVQVMDQSFAESNISKRFARTKNNSNQHMKSGRQVKQHLTLHTNKSTSKQAQKEGKLLSNYIKTDDFFIKINQTPKNKPYFTPISSDRATESTNLKSRQQSDSMVFNSNTHGKETVAELKSQLQLKSAQLMFLQDEVMRLKRQLIWKQQQLIKLNIRKEKEYQAQLTRLKQQIKMLQQESVSKSNEIKQQKKIESGLNRQIKSLKYDKTVLEKHIEELYKMKLTKDLKELISFRELSLIKQIEELKARLSQNKSEAEVKMQEQIRRLKEENNEKIADLKKIQVHTRIMNRKMMENQNELKEKTQTFSKYYMSMKQSQNDLIDQLKKARKENIKLRRLHILSHSHLSKKLICQSSESSLNISLSSSN